MAIDVDVRSGGGHAGHWAADAMALSFAQASSSVAEVAEEASTVTGRRAVLVCRDGRLGRRRTATVMSAMMRMPGAGGAWKRRRLVLLLVPQSRRPTTTARGGAATGVAGEEENDAVPMLLMYRVDRGDDEALEPPTGIIRLASGSGDGRLRASVEGVEGHPRRLEVRLNLPSSDDSLGLAFVGSDAPRRKKKKPNHRGHRFDHVEAPDVDVVSWGFKFPDAETATLWAVTMRRLAEPRRTGPTTTMAAAASADDGVTSAVASDGGGDDTSVSASGARTTGDADPSDGPPVIGGAADGRRRRGGEATVGGRRDGGGTTNLAPPTAAAAAVVVPAAPPSPPRNEDDGEAEEAEVESTSTPLSATTAASSSPARDFLPTASGDDVASSAPTTSSRLRRRLTNGWIRSSASAGGGRAGRNGGDGDDATANSAALPDLAPATPTRVRTDGDDDDDDDNDEDEREIDTGNGRNEEGVVIVASAATPRIGRGGVGGGGGDDVDGGGGGGGRGKFFTVVVATAIFFCASIGLLVESGVTAWWVDETAAAFAVLPVLLGWGLVATVLRGGGGPGTFGGVAAAGGGGGDASGNTSGLAALVGEIMRGVVLSILLPLVAVMTVAGVAAALVLFVSGYRKLGMGGCNTDQMPLQGDDTLPDVVHFSPFAYDMIYEATKNLTISFKLAAIDAVHPTELVDDETPEPRTTPWRGGLSLLDNSLGPSGPFRKGSFVRTYYWMILPASAVWAVSVSSIACSIFPRLGLFASSRRRYYIPAVVLGSVGILLGHDAWVNHWTRPIRYGLYWRGYLRSTMALGCLSACGAFLERGAMVRRSTVSPARRVSGGVSLCLAALSVPLTMRSLHGRVRIHGVGVPPHSPASPVSWSDASGRYGALAFVAFFAGLYFFGRARRSMTVFGIPVGELVHRFSILPANMAYLILGVAGDALHFVFEVARHQLLRFVRGVLMPVVRASLRCLRRALRVAEQFGRDMVDVVIVGIRRATDATIAFWRDALVPALCGLATVCANFVRVIHRWFLLPACRFAARCIERLVGLVTDAWGCLCRAITSLCHAVRTMATRLADLLGPLLAAAAERVRLAVVFALTRCVVPMVNLVRDAGRVALTMAVKWAMRASRVAINLMRRLLSHAMRALCCFCDAVASVLDWLWDHTARMARALFAKARDLSTTVWQMTTEVWRKYVGPAIHHVLGALRAALETLWELLSLACRFVLNRAVAPTLRFGLRAGRALARASRECLKSMCDIARYWFDCFVSVCGRIHRRLRIIFSRYIYPPAKTLRNLIVSFMSAFLRKYWHLIPAGLVLNGSFLFAGAAIAGNGTNGGGGLLFARLQYALGSWSLFLIGCTHVHAVISSRGNLVDQHVIIDQSILRHVDLHLGYVVSRVLVSGWHALSTVLKIILNAIDFMIRQSFGALWRVIQHVNESVLRPLFRMSKAALWRVWNYPYLSIIASLTVLGSLYLYHTGKIAINIPASCWSIGSSSTFHFLVHTVPSKCFIASRTVHRQTLVPLEHSVVDAYKHLYEPLVHVDVSSPSVALFCWILTCLVTKARARVRLKLFAVPVVVLYMTGVRATAVMRAYCVSYTVWIVLSVLVDRYEDRERRRAGVAFDTYQSGRRQRRQSQFPSHTPTQKVTQSLPVSYVVERLAFLQTECCICLERFDDGGGANKSKLAELPCGHCFHEPCIDDWLLRCDNRRCPICRRATRGWDRVLEVAF